jgi:hypothetical protein
MTDMHKIIGPRYGHHRLCTVDGYPGAWRFLGTEGKSGEPVVYPADLDAFRFMAEAGEQVRVLQVGPPAERLHMIEGGM